MSAKKIVVVKKSKNTYSTEHVDESKINKQLSNDYHNQKENINQKSTRKSIIFMIILFSICGVIYFTTSTGNFDSDPYNKIYKSTIEEYGETLNMYLIVRNDYCKFAVGEITNYSNSCSVSKNSSGEYILTLDTEKYRYTSGNFECTNCSYDVVFKYYKSIDN